MIGAYFVEQIRAAETAAMARLADGALMQRAAMGLAVACAGLLDSVRGQVVGSRVVALVGSGNNGGDALWAGAMLRARGCRVDVIQLSSGIHAEGASALLRAGGRIHDMSSDVSYAKSLLEGADLVLDGIVGIGGHGGLREPAASLVSGLESCDAIIVAVDLPSGVDADSGVVSGSVVVDADVTVTFGCLKPGLVLAPGAQYSGSVVLVDIGLEEHLAEVGPPAAVILEGVDVAMVVPEPHGDAYKYSRAVVGISAGSREYPGAALLATAAARHANVGMVRYLDRSDGNAARVVDHFPDTVVDGAAPSHQARAKAWACGPGFVGHESDLPTVRAVLAADVPVVLDAGALQVIADSDVVREDIRQRHDRGLATVITPHEGEFRRIAPGVLETSDGRLSAALTAARDLGAIVVLKGPGTVIAAPTGEVYIDTEGTADLGTAGSGDVLTGIAGALLAGEDEPGDETACLRAAAAVWLHGRAGRLAATKGPVTATDIAGQVSAAFNVARFGDSQVSDA